MISQIGERFNTIRLMGLTGRRSEGFGSEVVLGLLVRQPANCYQLDRRLSERFGSAEYTRGTARQAVARLVSVGLVRAVGAGEQGVGDKCVSRTMLYEATPSGVEHFRAWMWESVATPPLREELHAKVALCQSADLPRMIGVVRGAEAVCVGKLADLNFRIRSRRAGTDPESWEARMDLVVSTGDQAWWESRIKWLQRVRMFLEEEWRRCQQISGSRMVTRRTA
jgi:DNA-binding PadR family transcriptional regulator